MHDANIFRDVLLAGTSKSPQFLTVDQRFNDLKKFHTDEVVDGIACLTFSRRTVSPS